MKPVQSNDDPQDLRSEENDPVWHLLGESPRPQPDAWFAVRTLARCRYAADAKFLTFRGAWRWALGCTLALSLALVPMVRQVNVAVAQAQPQVSAPAPDQQKNVQEAFEIMASIDTSDSDSSSTPTWQDSSL